MGFISLLAVLLSVDSLYGQTGNVRNLSIIHSNDLHARLLPDNNQKGGFAYLATLERQERAGCDHCLYVNAGDLVQGTPVSTLFKGIPVYEIGNKFRFDMATLGNHEFDYGYAQIPRFLKIARYPVATANLTNSRDGRLMTAKPYIIKKVNGMRIALIGAVMGNLVSGYLKPQDAGPWQASPVVETVARYVKEVRPHSDLIVVVGHIQPAEGTAIIHQIPDVAAVIEGHEHRGMKELEVFENRVAANCSGYGIELCRLDLQVDVAQKKLVSWNWKKIPVDSKSISPAPDVKKLVDKWEARVSKVVDVRIGEATRDFDETALVPVLEQAVRDEMQADFTFMNRGGVRDRLPKGVILARNVWNIMPFDNVMMVARVQGAQVPASMKKDRELDSQREYVIAIPDFLATNTSNKEKLGLGGLQFQPTTRYLRDVIIEWIKKKKIVG